MVRGQGGGGLGRPPGHQGKRQGQIASLTALLSGQQEKEQSSGGQGSLGWCLGVREGFKTIVSHVTETTIFFSNDMLFCAIHVPDNW